MTDKSDRELVIGPLPIQDDAITTSRPYRVQLKILSEATIMASSEEEALMEAREIVDTLGVIDNTNRVELAVLLVTMRI